MKARFLSSLISSVGMLVLFSALASPSISFAEGPCTAQEMIYEGKLALEPELILSPQNIHYKILGEQNRKVIVLIHGLGGSLHTWWEVAKDLASQDYKVIIYDQRGHGDTQAKGENYSSAMMASDLKALLDYLKVDQVDVLGHSMGARTAMRFANLFPERVKSVIVEDMHMMGRRTLLPDNLDYSRQLSTLKNSVFRSYEEGEDAAFRLLGIEPESNAFFRLGLDYSHTDNLYRFMDIQPQVPLYSSQGLQEDLTAALASVKVPLLFLAAEEEPVLFGKGIDHLKTTNPQAQVSVIPGTHHGMHDSNFEGYMSRLKNFLKSVP